MMDNTAQTPQPKLEEVFDPSSQAYCENPIEQSMALMARGPFVFYEPWQSWIMTDIKDIMECWQKEYLSSDFYDWEFAPPRPPEDKWGNFERALIGHSLVADHSHHRLIRKVVSPAFSRNVVDEIQRRIEPDIDRLLDDLGTPESFDYIKEVAEHIPFISITRIVGIPEKYWDEIKPLIENFTETWNPTISEERREEVRQQCNHAIDIIKVIIAERRKESRQDDFLSVMLKIEAENDKFTEWDIITLILALIGAGADTTLMAQQWSVYALVKHPDQRKLALASPEAFSNAFTEILRWSMNSKMGFARYAPEDMEVLGHQVRQGQLILMMPHLSKIDPELYPEPEKLDVTREFNPDVLFGYGPRYCIGAAMAKRQLYLTMTKLFERFPNIKLASEPERDPSNHNSVCLKSLDLKTGF